MKDSAERIVRRLAKTNPIDAEYMVCSFCRGAMREGHIDREPDRKLDHRRTCVWLRAKRWIKRILPQQGKADESKSQEDSVF